MSTPALFVDYLATDGPAIEAQRFFPGHVAETFAVHGHRFHEIVVFLEGGGEHRVGRDLRPVARGAIDIIPEGIVHDTRGLRGAHGWMFVVRPDAAALLRTRAAGDAFARGVAQRLYATDATLARLDDLCRSLLDEATQRRPGYDEALAALATMVLIEIGRVPGFAAERTDAPADQLERLIATIDLRLTDDLRLPDLAHALGYTPAYLTAELRRRTGRSVMDWVVARRLRAACRLLLETDEPVEAIAGATGFVDGSHLARRFRHAFQRSPATWRREQRALPQSDTGRP